MGVGRFVGKEVVKGRVNGWRNKFLIVLVVGSQVTSWRTRLWGLRCGDNIGGGQE